VIALSRSRAPSRSRTKLVSFSVVGLATLTLWLSGCRNRQEEARQKAELTSALAQYRAQIGELQKQASVLRARFDKLPEDLPDIGPVRDNLHALEEVLGVEDGRTKWLSAELDKAVASGKKQDLEAVRKAIPRSTDGIVQFVVKVTHQMAPLERLANQRHFFEAQDAANAKAAAAKEAAKERPPKTR